MGAVSCGAVAAFPAPCPTSTLRRCARASVYLPDALKAELATLADRTGRSEAELIRLAIERLVRSGNDTPVVAAPAARPAPPPVAPRPPAGGRGGGAERPRPGHRAGAGRPAGGRPGWPRPRASTPSAGPRPWCGRPPRRGRRPAGDRHRVGRRAREASLDRAAATLVEHLDRGDLVAVALLGDPNVWSVFSRLARAVAAGGPGLRSTPFRGSWPSRSWPPDRARWWPTATRS